MMSSESLSKRTLLSVASHAAIFLSTTVISFLIPLVILWVSDDPVVQTNARESLNFHFNVWFYGIIVGILTWFLIGWLFVPILAVLTWIAPIIAIVGVFKENEKPFVYPFIFHII